MANEPVVVTPQPKAKSKTLWFSGLVSALGALAVIMPQAQEVMVQNPGWVGIGLVATGLISAFLRTQTKAPLA